MRAAKRVIVVAEEISNEDEASRLGSRLLETISAPLPGVDSTVVTASRVRLAIRFRSSGCQASTTSVALNAPSRIVGPVST